MSEDLGAASLAKEKAMTHLGSKAVAVAQADIEYVVPQTEVLLRRLVAQLDCDSAFAVVRVLRRTPELIDEVILESSIDGRSYYLVRSQPIAKAQIGLSPRELAIARLIAKGLPNKCIGDILEISPWTVATHLRRIFVKLGVPSRAAMVARLGEENLL
jgi:two-component system, NarL family, nitrate/nitrite response regulator NarL